MGGKTPNTNWPNLIQNVLVGQITGFGGLILFVAVPLQTHFGIGTDYCSTLPSHKEMFWNFVFFVWVQKTLFFYIHWAFHSRWLYRGVKSYSLRTPTLSGAGPSAPSSAPRPTTLTSSSHGYSSISSRSSTTSTTRCLTTTSEAECSWTGGTEQMWRGRKGLLSIPPTGGS